MPPKITLRSLNEYLGLEFNFKPGPKVSMYRAKTLRFFEEDGHFLVLIELKDFWQKGYKTKVKLTPTLMSQLKIEKKKKEWR